MLKAILLSLLAITLSAHRHRHNHGIFNHHAKKPIFDLIRSQRQIFSMPSIMTQQRQMMDSFDALFNKLQERMESEMQQAQVDLPVISVKKVVVEQTPNPNTIEAIAPKAVGGDIAKCIQLLQEIMIQAAEVAQEAKNKEWAKLLPKVLDLIQKTIVDIECFKNSSVAEIADMALARYSEIKDDKRQCIIDHLMKAFTKLKAAVSDFVKGDIGAAVVDVQDAMDIIGDAATC